MNISASIWALFLVRSTSFQEFHKELVRVVRDGVHCLHRGELSAMPGAVGFLLLAEFHAVHDAGRFLLRDWLHDASQ